MRIRLALGCGAFVALLACGARQEESRVPPRDDASATRAIPDRHEHPASDAQRSFELEVRAPAATGTTRGVLVAGWDEAGSRDRLREALGFALEPMAGP